MLQIALFMDKNDVTDEKELVYSSVLLPQSYLSYEGK